MIETNEISIHLCRIYLAAVKNNGWFTSSDIATEAKVSKRTARAHCLRLVRAGIFDQAELFPAHRYKFSSLANKRNVAMVQRIEKAAAILDVK